MFRCNIFTITNGLGVFQEFTLENERPKHTWGLKRTYNCCINSNNVIDSVSANNTDVGTGWEYNWNIYLNN